MDFRKQSHWLNTLCTIILALILCGQQSACSLSGSNTIKSKPILEIQKVPIDQKPLPYMVTKKPEVSSDSKNQGLSFLSKSDAGYQAISKTEVLHRDIVRSTKPAFTKPAAPKPKPKKEQTASTPKKTYTGKPISLDFQDADIRSVLRLISEISGHNLVIDPDVKGKVTITLHKKVPWDQALEIILKTNRLAMKMEGNIIRVGTRKSFTQEEEALFRIIQAKQKTKQLEKKSLPLKTEIISVNYARAVKMKDQLTPMLSKSEELMEPPSIIVDERTNSLIIKDSPENIIKIKEILVKLDKETPQVLIETRIVETTKEYSKELGVRWGGSYQKQTNNRFPNTINVAGIRSGGYAVNLPNTGDVFGGLGFNLGHVNGLTQLNIELDAMESNGKGRIISNPKIATLDNERAEIKSGSQIPYPAIDKDGNPTTQFVDAVIKLAVTPHITPNGFIILEIEADKSEPNWSKTVNGVPAIKTRTAKTKLIVKDGDTAVIGGLYQHSIQNSERKVPWFGNIPVIKWLFKANRNEDSYDELLIFITPKIMGKKT